jgi:hypothetical protein
MLWLSRKMDLRQMHGHEGKTTIKNANEDMLCSEMLYTMEIVLDPFGSLTTITNSSAG